ncbi:S8 family serine peptidase [Halostreptopolyspora alba]
MRTSTTGLFAAGVCGALTVHLTAVPPATADSEHDLRHDQPGLETVGAAETWDLNRGGGITVAVLDTGVDDSHPDLRGRVTLGDDLTGQDLEPGDDGYGERGTGVAGIIAASGHGQEHSGGVLGVAPDAEILSIRVTRDEDASAGGEVSDEALRRGINHAASEGAQVIALPASGGEDIGDGEREAVRHAVRTGALVVAPAGSALAGQENVLGVGAVDGDLRPVDGGDGEHVALRAPGTDIATIAPDNGYTRLSGSAAAAGFVAGAAALIRAEHPQLLPGQVSDALVNDSEVLRVPDAVEEAGTIAEDIPLYDEDLVPEDEDPLVPVWGWWAGGALLLVLLVALAVWLGRSRSDPYGVREAAGEDPGHPAESGQGRATRRRRGRRRAHRATSE